MTTYQKITLGICLVLIAILSFVVEPWWLLAVIAAPATVFITAFIGYLQRRQITQR